MGILKDFLPTELDKLLTWSNNFDTKLTANPTAVGCTSGQASTFHTLNLAWNSAFALSQSDETRSPAKIIARNNAKDAMVANARLLSKIIQAYPGTTDEMRSNLGLNVRKTPTRAGAPGTPYGFKFILETNGSLTMTWKNKDATSCMYQIYRVLDGSTTPESLGGTGAKKFTDSTIPAGTMQVQYQVQAIRSTGVSAWANNTVKFSTSSSELTVTQDAPLKAAA